MKKQILLISALMFSMLTFSQGIEFEHGTWKEVLEKAQQTKKPIFVDVFTSWCGPCKKMSKDIFPLEEVGKYFNANFVCYKVDAEKGEGVDIAKKYEVTAYPTYIFVKPDGSLFFRAVGSMEAKDFIAKGEEALSQAKEDKPLNVWESEYESKKNDPDFLKGYIKKRMLLGLSTFTLMDEYLKLLPESERTSDFILDWYEKEKRSIIINTLVYSNVNSNRTQFDNRFSKKQVDQLLYSALVNTARDASKTKNEQLLNQAMAAYDQVPKEVAAVSKGELYMMYYQATGETEKYMIYANKLCSELMAQSMESIQQKDNENLKAFEDLAKQGAFGKADSSEISRIKNYFAKKEKNSIGMKLNASAWKVFQEVSDKKTLKNALAWSKRSLELIPDNPSWKETYAYLLYKSGKKKQAIEMVEKELSNTTQETAKKKLEESIRKMKAGEKTWKN